MAAPINLWDNATFELVKAAFSAFAGATIGALTAGLISARKTARDDLVKELRAVNLTATIAYGITDAFISVKKGNVKPMYDKWISDKERREQLLRSTPPGQTPVFMFDAEFKTLTPVKTGVEQLRQLMFAGIILPARTIALVNTLDRSVEQHSQMIEALNDRSKEFHALNLTEERLAAVYLGLKQGKRIDDRYPTTLVALHDGTDDCIFFSKLLGDDLVEYGKTVAAKLPKRLRGKYAKVDFTKAEQEGLMPDPANYASWTTMFQVADPPQSFWESMGWR